MSKSRDGLALALAAIAVLACALVILMTTLLQGWWMLLFTPAAAGLLLGLAGLGTYRLD